MIDYCIILLILCLLLLLLQPFVCRDAVESYQWGMSGPIVAAYMEQAAARSDPLSNALYTF